MTSNKKIVVDFNPALFMIGIVTLYLVAIWILYLELNFGNLAISAFSISVFLFIYSTIVLKIYVKRIIRNDDLVLIKVFNSLPFSDVLFVNIILIGKIGILRLRLKNKKNVFGLYLQLYNEHVEIIDLFKEENINYKVKKLKFI